MKATDLLLNRQSNGLLTTPAPDEAAMDFILQAGMRVPDHAGLTPWHFTIVQNGGLDKLSDLFVNAATLASADKTKLEKVKKMPFRAPLIIVISTQYKKHDKVPEQEQLIAAGCCAYAMQMASFSLGYGAMWRTGEFSYNGAVKKGLGIAQQDEIVGYLYIGSNQKTLAKKAKPHYSNFVSYL